MSYVIRSWSTAMRGGKGLPVEKQSSAKARWQQKGEGSQGRMFEGGCRERQGFYWVVARVRLQGAFSAIGRSLDFSWGVGYGSF